jgi:hypothetical protein
MKNILVIAGFIGIYLYLKKKTATAAAPLYKPIDNSLFGSTVDNSGVTANGSSSGSGSSSTSTAAAAHAAVAAAKAGVSGGLATFSDKVSPSKSCFR